MDWKNNTISSSEEMNAQAQRMKSIHKKVIPLDEDDFQDFQ